jgi:predicted peptidase
VGVAGLAIAITAGTDVVDEVTGLIDGPGTNVSGAFYSRYRRRTVGYTVGYPDGASTDARIPFAIYMHGYRGDHTNAVPGHSPGGAASLASDIRHMAIVTVDGGQGYWHPHPGDDPMRMVVNELIPMMRARGLGLGVREIAVMGTSMGGYGAIIFAEHYRGSFASVGAISPAIFDSFAWAHYVNPGAFWSAKDFATYDAISHAGSLSGTPLRVASGEDDPFHPWVEDFARVVPAPGQVVFPPGAHTAAFFNSQIEPAVRFVASHFP